MQSDVGETCTPPESFVHITLFNAKTVRSSLGELDTAAGAALLAGLRATGLAALGGSDTR